VRELRRLDRQAIPRVLRAVEAVAHDPVPARVRKLTAAEHTYRPRVGDCRVVYELAEGGSVAVVKRVRHRKDAYRQMPGA
jgi:mRNA interferase RelE/StbE